jgi:hypothetical protein
MIIYYIYDRYGNILYYISICSGSVLALGKSNPNSIPGSSRDAFAGVNMPLAPFGVSAGSLCHVQQKTVLKPYSPLD